MPHETTHRFLASELPVAEPESCLFHVLPVPLEATVSYAGGTARGPEAILEASDQLELWDGESVPAEAGIYTWPAVDISGSPETVLGRVEAAVGGILDCNGLPVLLGGEHTVTYGALAALKKRFGTFGIIQFDAHADLRDSYEGSPWSHACVMRRAVRFWGRRWPSSALGPCALTRWRHARNTASHSMMRHPLPATAFPNLCFPRIFPARCI